MNHLKHLVGYYKSIIHTLPVSEQIGVLLWDYWTTKQYQLTRDSVFDIDRTYSSVVTNQTYLDGTEKRNTIYGAMFHIALELMEAGYDDTSISM